MNARRIRREGTNAGDLYMGVLGMAEDTSSLRITTRVDDSDFPSTLGDIPSRHTTSSTVTVRIVALQANKNVK